MRIKWSADRVWTGFVLLVPLVVQGVALPAVLSPPQLEATKTSASASLEFAVISVKRIPPGPFRGGFSCHGIDGNGHLFDASFNNPLLAPQGRCVGIGVSPPALIAYAYDIEPTNVLGGPDWIRGNLDPSQTFQIEAVAQDPSTTTTQQLKQMLQTMLADRFKLKFHRKTQESAGYALVLAKNGSKLKKTSVNAESPFSTVTDKREPMIKGKSSLDQLAAALRRFVGPVVNKTGLMETYEYEFVLPNMSAQGGRGAGADSSDVSAALQDQLGLRLQAEKVPVEMIIIDQIERPSPN
jgi:uncharacterized protein (TIGR03435 family)